MREAHALLGLGIVPRVVVDLEIGVLGCSCCGRQVELGLLEVVVAEGDLARSGAVPLGDDTDRVVTGVETSAMAIDELLVAVDRIAHRAVVLEHHDLAGVPLVGEEEDALFFEEPRDERQRALVVLNAVLSLRIFTREAPRLVLVADAEIAKHLGDDLLHVLVLEDAAIDLPLQQPQDRGHVDPVAKVCSGLILG